jgi:hypothetical protein
VHDGLVGDVFAGEVCADQVGDEAVADGHQVAA